MDMAQALVAAGLSTHPDSEDVLVIAALVAEMNQDWSVAQDCLEHLIVLRGHAASPEIHYHLVRVMRCRSSYHQALIAARRGLSQHPEHTGLAQECAELVSLLEAVPVLMQVEAQTD